MPTIGSSNIFLCSDTGWEETHITESTPYAHREVSYQYRLLIEPNSADIICWDSHPHRPQHSVFVWLNHPNRNVLLADGQVKNMREDEFQKLHLSGQSWTLP